MHLAPTPYPLAIVVAVEPCRGGGEAAANARVFAKEPASPEADVPRCSSWLDRPAHDPGVLADAATPGEAVLLEELDRRAEEEAALCVATGG